MVAKHGKIKNKGDNKMKGTFQNKCLRNIMKIKFEDHVRNEDLLRRTKMRPISEEASRRRWKFIGHTLRQDPTSDCNTALTWATKEAWTTKNNMAPHSGERESRYWLTVMERDQSSSSRQNRMETLCGGPMCHQARGG